MKTVEKINYRLFQKEDLGGILQLWETHSGWGGITEQQFTDWYINTPYGKCIIVVMTGTNNEIAGEMVLIPNRIYYNGQEYKGIKFSAPIIDSNYRTLSLRDPENPLNKLVQLGLKTATELGFEITYTLPAYGWIPIIEKLWKLPTETFNCFLIKIDSLANKRADLTEGFYAQQIFSYTISHYNIWKQFIETSPSQIGVVRHPDWLNWKFGGHLLIEVRKKDNDELLGIVAIKPQTGLIADVIAKNERDRIMLLYNVTCYLNENKKLQHDHGIKKVTGMISPFFQPFLNEIAFEVIDFTFAFSFDILNNKSGLKSAIASNWFILPED